MKIIFNSVVLVNNNITVVYLLVQCFRSLIRPSCHWPFWLCSIFFMLKLNNHIIMVNVELEWCKKHEWMRFWIENHVQAESFTFYQTFPVNHRSHCDVESFLFSFPQWPRLISSLQVVQLCISRNISGFYFTTIMVPQFCIFLVNSNQWKSREEFSVWLLLDVVCPR